MTQRPCWAGSEAPWALGQTLPVDRDTAALCDKADDLIAGNWGTAAGEFQHTRVDALHDDAAGVAAATAPSRSAGYQCGLLPGQPGWRAGGRPAHWFAALTAVGTAIADGSVHIVQTSQKLFFFKPGPQDIWILQDRRLQVHPGAARPRSWRWPWGEYCPPGVLFFKPLLDLAAGLVSLVQICSQSRLGPLAAFWSQNPNDIACFSAAGHSLRCGY